MERIMTTINGDKPDQVAVAPELFGITAKLNGKSIHEYVTDGKVIADAQLKAHSEIGNDVVFAFADLSVEAEAIGCKLRYEKDAYPSVDEVALRDLKDVKDLRLPDPLKDGRMPVVLEACRLMREQLKDSCPIVACVMGPFSLASQLLGIEHLLYQIVDNPEGVQRLLDFTEKVAILYGIELIKAGAHAPVVFDPSASSTVIPPEMFVKLEAPRLKRMYEAYKAKGVRMFWLSIAGQTKKILPYFKVAGVNIATIDYMVSLSEAFMIEQSITYNGNIKPYLFISASEEEIRHEVNRCFREASNQSRYIVGSGCEVPIEARIENIKALVEATVTLR